MRYNVTSIIGIDYTRNSYLLEGTFMTRWKKAAHSVASAAEAIDMSERFIRDKIKAGEIRHSRLGLEIRIPDEALREFINRHMEEDYNPRRKFSAQFERRREREIAR